MDFGYFLYRIDHPEQRIHANWTLLAFAPVPLDPTALTDPVTTTAIEDMTTWAAAHLAGHHRDYDLVNICLASVDENGDPEYVLAERYHVMLDGSPLETGTTVDLRHRAAVALGAA